MTFTDLRLHPDLLKGLAELGFAEPMPIQAEAIPHLMDGRDVIASAETGSGKTAAFMLPILHRLLVNGAGRSLEALVLAPTRELALQSANHLEALAKHSDIRGTAIFGGAPMGPQIRALERGVHVISATPGRLLDHASQRRIDFSRVHTLVLDEADRMLDMGFLPDVRRIIGMLPRERQTVIVSATIPAAVAGMIAQICRDPVSVQVGVQSKPPERIRHAVYPVNFEQKTDLLLHILRKMPDLSSVIVFSRTKEGVDRVGEALTRNGIRNACLHGDRDQKERERALEALKAGDMQVLVATDLVARGIDIKDLSHVVNFDPPDTPETYVHRIGRTGRVNAEGDALTLMAPEEESWIKAIEAVIGRRIDRVKEPDFNYKKSEIAGSYHPRPNYIRSFARGGRRGPPPRRS